MASLMNFFFLLLAVPIGKVFSQHTLEGDKALLYHHLGQNAQERVSENLRGMKLNFEKSDLAKAAAKHAQDGHIIFTGADSKYRDMLLNWVLALEMLGIHEYLILCYDRELYDLVGHWDSDARGGGRGVLMTLDNPCKGNFWMAKLFAMDVLINLGYAATWVDTDGIFLRGDLIEKWILPQNGKMDMIGQMGRAPLPLSEAKGPTYCTGLFTMFPTVRTNEAVKRMIRAYGEMTEQEFLKLPGDQAMVNYVVDEYAQALPVFNEQGMPVDYGLAGAVSLRESSSGDNGNLQRALDEIYGPHSTAIDYLGLMLRSHTMYGSDGKLKQDLGDNVFRMGILPYAFFPRGHQDIAYERHWDEVIMLGYRPFFWHIAPYRPCEYISDNKPGSMRMRRVLFQSLETGNITSFNDYKDFLHRDILLYDYCSREEGAMEGLGGCSDPQRVEEIKADIRKQVEEAKAKDKNSYPDVDRKNNILERYHWKATTLNEGAPQIAVLHPLINDGRSRVAGCGGKDYVDWTVNNVKNLQS